MEPFQRTTDETTKLLPVTVRIAPPALPASTRLGNSAPRDGTGLLIVKACPAEVPPPGAELSTVTVTVPPSRRSPAAIDAVSCAVLTNVVARSAPFHRTTDVETKPLPLTVSVNGAPPAVVLDGATEPIEGAGLSNWSCATNVPQFAGPVDAVYWPITHTVSGALGSTAAPE